MQGRLNKTIRYPFMKVLMDFDKVGFSQVASWHDITEYVLDISGSKEKTTEEIGGISSDIATFIVDNSQNAFANDNPISPFYGKIKPNIEYALYVGFKNEAQTLYTSGYVEAITPAWRDKQYQIKVSDYFSLFRNTDCPTEGYQSIAWDELVNVLCDHVGLPVHIIRNIPKTEFHYSYFKFEEDNCFDALRKLMEVAVGQAYFEQGQFVVKTKLALDYQLDTAVKHDITVNDIFDFEEIVDDSKIINTVTLKSDPKVLMGEQPVFETPENVVKVTDEIIKYTGLTYIQVDQKNLPIIMDADASITIKNLMTGEGIGLSAYERYTGKIYIHANDISKISNGDPLAVSYPYQQLALMAGQTRTYVLNPNEEIDSLAGLDVVVWDENGDVGLTFSQTPNTPNSVSLQKFQYNTKEKTITVELKNNYASPITISTLQVQGYPIKVLNPIEVTISDQASVDEYKKRERSYTNNYFNNARLAEKVSQFITDNYSQPRKNINVEIDGYPEMLLNDVTRVTEEGSGTNHKFTVERVDYTFNLDSGWNAKVNLLQLDTEPWSYETFAGESWQKSNSGTPDFDFVLDISANLVRNGGAELHTGTKDFTDAGATGGQHYVPDYWQFYRVTGDAAARIRTGGNLVLHAGQSFEVTTTNSGAGYFEQTVPGARAGSKHFLTFLGRADGCTAKVIVKQYDGSTLLKEDTYPIAGYAEYEYEFTAEATTDSFVVQFHKEAGAVGIESFVFDKVKLESAEKPTPYVETEQTQSVQANQLYANSVTIGNNYGIEVYDDTDQIRVRMGQYEPNKYGLWIDGGHVEIGNGGLRIENLHQDIGLNLDISQNATIFSMAQDISTINGYVSEHTSILEQHAESIAASVTKGQVTDWGNRFFVSSSSTQEIKNLDGTSLSKDFSYEIQAKTVGVAEDTLAIVYVKGNGTSFILEKVYEKGTTTNHPEVFLNSGVPYLRLYSGATSQNVDVTIRKFQGDRSIFQVLDGAIQLRVTEDVYTTDMDGINQTLTSHSSSITANAQAIQSKVSASDYNGNTIVSMINQTATTIDIAASKINLVGAVTVLSDITGNLGTITAGTINISTDINVGKTLNLGNGWTDSYSRQINFTGNAFIYSVGDTLHIDAMGGLDIDTFVYFVSNTTFEQGATFQGSVNFSSATVSGLDLRPRFG